MELPRNDADAKQAATRTAPERPLPAERPPTFGEADCDEVPEGVTPTAYGCVDWYQY